MSTANENTLFKSLRSLAIDCAYSIDRIARDWNNVKHDKTIETQIICIDDTFDEEAEKDEQQIVIRCLPFAEK